MASNAKKKFEQNIDDIEVLLEIHGLLEDMGNDSNKPIPKNFDVLFRSATVLLVSNWEAYIEDICSEALEFLIENISDSKNIPKEIKKQISKEIQSKAKNEIEMWELAGDGWKTYLKNRLGKLKEGRDRSFNTPKSIQTSEFIKQTLGIENIQTSWKFDGLESAKVSKKLDHLVSVRGEIAHRGVVKDKLDSKWVTDHLEFIRKLSSKTGGQINASIKKSTGKSLW